MKKWLVNFAIILMIIGTTFGCGSFATVRAEEDVSQQLNIVALGDSISTGYGLNGLPSTNSCKNNENLFLNKIKETKNATLTNLANDGDESADLYNLITLTENYQILSNANTILITIGGNDILQPLLSALENALPEGTSLSSATETEISIAMFTLLSQQAQIQEDLDAGIENFSSNFPNIAEALRVKNSEAQIIFQTVYNPAEKSADPIITQLYDFINPYILQINQVITNSSLKTQYNYEVFDTYSVFKNYEQEELLTNIDKFDIHPNILGNSVIYDGLVEMIKDIKEEQVNSTTIKIYTNNVYVNNPELNTPENPELPENPEDNQSTEDTPVGGGVEGLEKDDNGYDIFEIPVNSTKDLVITTNENFRLVDVKLGEESVGALEKITLDGANLPNTISIYFLQEFQITYSVGYNGYLTVDSTILNTPESNLVKEVLYGGSLPCSFVANYSYTVDKVLVDEMVVPRIENNYTFINVTENHKFDVSFKLIEKTEDVNPTYNIKIESSTQYLKYGTKLIVEEVAKSSYEDLIINHSDNKVGYEFSFKWKSSTVTPTGKYKVSIPLPYGYNKEKTKLYHIDQDNKVTELNYSFDNEINSIVFETDKTSFFVLAEQGEPQKNYWWVWVIIGSVVLVATVVTIVIVVKKKKDKKIKNEIEKNSENEYYSY